MDVFLSGSSHPEMASVFNEKKGLIKLSKFADGELFVEMTEDLAGKNVLIFQSAGPPVDSHLMELFLILDAVRRAGAKTIKAFVPYMGYSRQDRLTAKGVPVSAELVLEFLKKAGAHQVLTCDFHSKRILDLFHPFLVNIETQSFLAEKWADQGLRSSFLCVSPDKGGLSRAGSFSEKMGWKPPLFIEKERPRPGEARVLKIHGSVKDQNLLIIDDIIDSAGTLCMAVDSLIKNGAKEVFALATHGLFSGPAVKRLEQSPVKKVFVSDTLPLKRDVLECSKIQVLPMAPFLKKRVESLF